MTSTVTRTRASAAPPTAPIDRFVGTWHLVRLAARRDRVLVPIWWAVFVMSAASSAAAVAGLYPTEADRVAAATQLNVNPALLTMFGPISDPTSLGQLAMFKMTAMGAAMVGLLSAVLVVRHSRGEEEAGRTELVGAGVVGRWAPLAAAIIAVTVTDLVLVLAVAGSLIGSGLGVVGSLSFAVAWFVTAITFAAVAAVSAQLASSGRGATGMATGVLGLAYLVRAVADGSDGQLSGLRWMSPVGWAQEVHAFGDIRWGVSAVGVGAAVLLFAVAFALVDRRDLGAGLLPDRAGRPSAARSLASPLALALRLHRGTLIGWALIIALFSQVLGGLMTNIDGMFEGNARQFIEALGGKQALQDAFMAAELSFIGLFLAAFAVAAVLRLRAEEAAGRSEALLATRVTRWSLAGAQVTIALGGAAALLTLTWLGIGFSASRATGDGTWWGKVAGAVAVQLPAIAVMVGVALLAVALLPRWAVGVSWGVLVTFFLLGEIGPILKLPTWLMDVSPFAHTPRLPGADVSAVGLVALSAVAVALIVAGLVAYRRRDQEP
jgi:ABC-2 type transport system permease protein